MRITKRGRVKAAKVAKVALARRLAQFAGQGSAGSNNLMPSSTLEEQTG
jgi:hypothetical protein